MNPTPRQITNGTFKLVDGIWHKKCTGPAHEEPEFLPATDKYWHTHKSGKMKGKFVPRCRLCINWDKLKNPGSHHGLVEVEKVFPLYNEAVNRIGIYELAQRAGVSRGHIEHVVYRETKHVVKAKVRKVLLELTSMKRKGEFSQSKSLRWRNDERNSDGLPLCSGCGGLQKEITVGCDSCRDRWYGLFKRKKITKKRWSEIQLKYFPGGRNLIYGREFK